MENSGLNALLDTGFLLALLNADDNFHNVCSDEFAKQRNVLLPSVVLPELGYMMLRLRGYAPLSVFLNSIANQEIEVVDAELADWRRAAILLEKYADSRIDFVDCVVVAIAERLNIRRILTIDRRHFQLVRPAHCEYFEIRP